MKVIDNGAGLDEQWVIERGSCGFRNNGAMDGIAHGRLISGFEKGQEPLQVLFMYGGRGDFGPQGSR